MRFRRLRRVIEGYRWLWRAQRRWRPGALWLVYIEFMARLVADLLLFVAPSRRGAIMGSRRPLFSSVVVGVGVAVAVLGVVVLRVRDRPSDVPPAEWRHDEGGFAVAFPTPWESASEDDVIAALPIGAPVEGSAYRRPTDGLLVRRFVSAEAYFLGETTSTRGAVTSLVNWVEGPVVILERARAASPSVRITSYRFVRRGVELTQAAILFRGIDRFGYMIGVTGRREDEAVVLEEARRIADVIRHEGPVLSDGDLVTAQLFDIPLEALEATRSMTLRTVERRDSARWSFRSMELNEAESVEECRAGAIVLANLGAPRLPLLEPISVFETLVTCPSSRVSMRVSMANVRPTLRQFDQDGALIFEAVSHRGVTPYEPQIWLVNGSRRHIRPDGSVVQVRIPG
jgi:hypothetical protein